MIKNKKAYIVLAVVILIWALMFITDYSKTKNQEEPIFSIHIASYEDGGSRKYIGLGYQVYYIKVLSAIEHEGLIEYGYFITHWFKNINQLKEDIM